MKFKLMTHKNIYTESLTQIKESNQQLRQFANDSYVLESCRKKRRAKYDKVDFQAIRNHARSLHNVIVSGRSWKCQCWKHHMASLRLEARSVRHFPLLRAYCIEDNSSDLKFLTPEFFSGERIVREPVRQHRQV